MPSSTTPYPLARPIGYAVVLGLAFLLFLAAGFVIREWTRSPHLVRIHFPEIATLAEGDPVVQGGVSVGVVRSIQLPRSTPDALESDSGRDAVVTIELFNSRPLARDVQFINFSHSLMGARKVWIVPGASGLSDPTQALDESRIQKGIFAPGLPETLHKADSLVALLSLLREQTERMLTNDNPLKSPLAAARALDSAAVRLNQMTAGLETARAALEAGLAGFSSAAHQTGQSLHAAEPTIHSALLKAGDWVKAVNAVQHNLDTVLNRVEKISALTEDSTGLGRFLNSDRSYQNLEKSVRVLVRVANLMKTDGLTDSLKIKPRLRSGTP